MDSVINEIENTRSPNRGQLVWQETTAGMTTSYECPLGPIREVGTRTCCKRDELGTSVMTSCATESQFYSLLLVTLYHRY